MSLLEWVLIIELLLIALAGMCWVMGYVMSQQEPNDPFWIMARTFWSYFLWPVVEAGPTLPPELKEKLAKRGKDEDDEDDDAKTRRPSPPKGKHANIDAATLGVTVVFNADIDRVVGRNSAGLLVEVTKGMADVSANREIVQLVSSALGLNAYQVTVTKGHFQAKKGLAVTGMSQDELMDRLGVMFSEV